MSKVPDMEQGQVGTSFNFVTSFNLLGQGQVDTSFNFVHEVSNVFTGSLAQWLAQGK